MKISFQLILIFSLFNFALVAQTKVSGSIFDKETNEPIPFCNVKLQSSSVGTATDFDGGFKLEYTASIDTIEISFIGYDTKKIALKLNHDNKIKIYLSSQSVGLEEVVVYGDKKQENPAHRIFKGIVKNRDKYDLDKLSAYEYESYNKIEFDLSNLTEKFKSRKVMKPFDFVFDNIDTLNGVEYLPILISESLSNMYFRNDPKKKKEIIKANEISGVKDESIEQFFGDMYQKINIYDNFVDIFGKNFISPFSKYGLQHYRYYITDSILVKNKKCYQLTYLPKHKQELTFSGDFWVIDSTYAVIKINGKINDQANINYIQHVSFEKEFENIDDSLWLPSIDNLFISFSVGKKSMGMFGKKTASYKNYSINKPKDLSFFEGDEVILPNEKENENIDWQNLRHDSLTEKELAIYKMVDSVKNVPQFNTLVNAIRFALTGYFKVGAIGLGPYSSLYSYNIVEGDRVSFGLETSVDFSKDFYLKGYLAYGFLDERYKYGGEFWWLLNKKKWTYFKFKYKNDVEQFGVLPDKFKNNIFTLLFSINRPRELINAEMYNFSFSSDIKKDFNLEVGLTTRNVVALGDFEFTKTNSEGIEKIVNLITFEPYFKLTYTPGVNWLKANFERAKLNLTRPEFTVLYQYGIKGVFGSQYNYHKISLGVKHSFYLGSYGRTDYQVMAGKVFGSLPYALQDIARGNETYGYELSAFNTMNYSEFVNDQYITAMFEHHFQGFFLNHVAGLRFLKLREVLGIRAIWGSFDKSNLELMNIPKTTYFLTDKPYAEFNVGIENILSIFRLDAVYRLTYLDHPFIQKFGLRGRIQLEF